MKLMRVNDGARLPDAAPGLALPHPVRMAAEAPDESWCAVDETGRAAGCLSLWWRRTARYKDQPAGYIGHFASAGGGVSALLLARARERLREEGCALAAGPIDGSTWRSYRLVTDPGDGPDFPLDIRTPQEWYADFRAAGFDVLETYCSVSLGAPAALGLDCDAHSDAVAAAGIRVRSIGTDALDRDLAAIRALSMQCFPANPFFAPIKEPDFLALYRPFIDFADPAYILLAEDSHGLCAFHFAFPYLAAEGRRNVVSKSMAVHPRMRRTGLGSHLLRRAIARAAQERAGDFIMAFMHDANLSAKWARAHGRVIRRYAVLGGSLA